MTPRRLGWVLLFPLLACGPSVPAGSNDEGTSSGGQAATTTTTTTTTASTSTSNGGVETGTSSGPDGGDSGNFLTDPDGGGGNENFECSVWQQDCPAGEKCMPWASDGGYSWNAARCSPLAPAPDQPGDPCTVEGSGFSGVDSCDLASMCWWVDPETLEGTCVAFCTGNITDPICDEPNHACSQSGDGVLIFCLPECDPVEVNCDEGQTCASVDQSFLCVPDGSGETGAVGDPCEFLNACDPGNACVPAADVPGCGGSSGCCSRACYTNDPDPGCLPGQTCLPWWEEGTAPPGKELYGVCGIPA